MATTKKKKIAKTLLQQLRGSKFIACKRIENFTCDNKSSSIICQLIGNKSKANYLRITLNANDLHTVEFLYIEYPKFCLRTGKTSKAVFEIIDKKDGFTCDMAKPHLFINQYIKTSKKIARLRKFIMCGFTGPHKRRKKMNETTKCFNGMLKIGDRVLVMPNDSYEGLVGIVTDIALLGSEKHESENITDDVYVNFENNYSLFQIMLLEIRFSRLYGEPKNFCDIPLDMVIMNPNSLANITNIDERKVFFQEDSCEETFDKEGNYLKYGTEAFVGFTIFSQLGGFTFAKYTGSYDFINKDNSLVCKLKENKSGADTMSITLTLDDLYTVEFYKGENIINKQEGVYCDMLQDQFMEITGIKYPCVVNFS